MISKIDGRSHEHARQWTRVERYIAAEQFTAARASLETLLLRAPDDLQACLLLSSVHLKLGDLRSAATQLLNGAARCPDDPGAIHRLAYCLHQVGETQALRDCLEHPAIARCDDPITLVALAHMEQLIGRHVRALALMDRAKALGLDDPDFRYFRSLQLQFNGRMEAAESEFEACLRLGPTYGRAWLALARMRKQTPSQNHLNAIAAQLRRVQPGTEHHAALEFARFKELDDLGQTDGAWDALQSANAIMHARVPHDSVKERRCMDQLLGLCSAEFCRPASTDAGAGAQPIFILGLPRSGTTLLERVLGNHTEVATPGELQDFPKQLRWSANLPGRDILDEALLARAAAVDYGQLGRRYLKQTRWRAEGKRAYVDKLPPNFMLAGFIHRALPGARILHMRRDPMDVCYSNWKAMFGDSYTYSYNLATLAAHYGQYARLMQHWRTAMPGVILDIDYARLVADPEAVAMEVQAFCGLPYEAGCGDIGRNRQPVSTISSPQVRAAIHQRSLGEWRRYESELQPLHKALSGA